MISGTGLLCVKAIVLIKTLNRQMQQRDFIVDSWLPGILMGVWFASAERQGALPRGEKYPLFRSECQCAKLCGAEISALTSDRQTSCLLWQL